VELREQRGGAPARQRVEDPYADIVTVQASPCYDLLVSLRALYNPRIYRETRGWASTTRATLDPALFERGRFFFQGCDTALGYGAGRLIPDLGPSPVPEDLIRAVRAAQPADLALLMLDTGETTDETLDLFRRVLAGHSDSSAEQVLHALPTEWARRCRRVLVDPIGVQSELASLLNEYLDVQFVGESTHVDASITAAAKTAEGLLALLPTAEVIERLTGGYTIGEDLSLKRITLAPSVFIHPFMSSRVDEQAGVALVIFGVASDVFLKYEPVPIDPALVRAMKALADPGRLRVLRLLGRGPMFGVELIQALRLAPPTVHHHLAQLRAAGLVRQERTKGGMRYTIRQDAAHRTLHELEELVTGAE
jgi:DNA-binding transcriptional ArsR family regulator